ncbi:hypothetical protein SOPP22_05300 [Shewanella sp. OPT22]|nr:hypothetical protein SOPP22_05300 [Shewanella sp. OPT22]
MATAPSFSVKVFLSGLTELGKYVSSTLKKLFIIGNEYNVEVNAPYLKDVTVLNSDNQLIRERYLYQQFHENVKKLNNSSESMELNLPSDSEVVDELDINKPAESQKLRTQKFTVKVTQQDGLIVTPDATFCMPTKSVTAGDSTKSYTPSKKLIGSLVRSSDLDIDVAISTLSTMPEKIMLQLVCSFSKERLTQLLSHLTEDNLAEQKSGADLNTPEALRKRIWTELSENHPKLFAEQSICLNLTCSEIASHFRTLTSEQKVRSFLAFGTERMAGLMQGVGCFKPSKAEEPAAKSIEASSITQSSADQLVQQNKTYFQALFYNELRQTDRKAYSNFFKEMCDIALKRDCSQTFWCELSPLMNKKGDDIKSINTDVLIYLYKKAVEYDASSTHATRKSQSVSVQLEDVLKEKSPWHHYMIKKELTRKAELAKHKLQVSASTQEQLTKK